MLLVVISFVAWLITPMLFSPFPRWRLVRQDLREFSRFVTGGAGTEDLDTGEVVSRGKRGTVRSLYECGLSDEMIVWTESPLFMMILFFVLKVAVGGYLALALPAGILDFIPVYFVALSFSWVAVLGYFLAGSNNVFLVLSFLIWPAAVPLAHLVIGSRFDNPSMWIRLPEYVISLAVFLFSLGLVKEFLLILCRCLCCSRLFPAARTGNSGPLHDCIRACFVYFLVHQRHIAEAYAILLVNTVCSLFLVGMDRLFCNAHTWFLLNNELARTKHKEKYMESNSATFFELDGPNYTFDLWGSTESDCSDGEETTVSRGDLEAPPQPRRSQTPSLG